MRLTNPHTLAGLMKDKGFSQTRLARAVGLKDHSFINHLVRGRKNTCKPETAERIAETLGVPLEFLFIPSLTADSGQTDKPKRTRGVAA